ncbi:Hypothetical predicted protein [Pelobates cultripes]|uniref:Uncharacterized protein n=1 Tax=Pelobates cultripes TaxID=61616 RepID=A0AAD1SUI4_PELCU|nr:Hypothetical predicted protein [Pelobates cultripes]
MKASRQHKHMPDQYRSIQLFTDLSALTLQKRWKYKDVTDALQAQNMPYIWGHPVRLLIHKNGTLTTVTSPDEGRKLLKRWGRLQQRGDKQASPPRLQPEWRKART